MNNIKNKIGRLVKKNKTTIFEGANCIGRRTDITNTKIGYGSYIGNDSYLRRVNIGRYCSIGNEVQVLYGKHPTKQFVSTHPAFYSTVGQAGVVYVDREKFVERNYFDSEKRITVGIGNDVWIASHVQILEGISIGDGAIVAAGALVTKDIPPYAIVAGVPAHIIDYRFEMDMIEWLLQLKWWDKDRTWIESHAECFEDVIKLKEKIEKELLED